MTARKPPATKSGDFPGSAAWGSVDDAVAYEAAIACEAAWHREQEGFSESGMTWQLFLGLWPLLCRPLHPGNIIHTTRGKGKPYASDGVRSLQVLVDRMNAVLTPIAWDMTTVYEEAGKLCEVTVNVRSHHGTVLVSRSSWGGVGQGSTLGNIYKGSATNAGKLAFARLGPGAEIYAGAIDLDPDVNKDIAKLQERRPSDRERTGGDNAEPPTPEVREAKPEDELAALLAVEDAIQELRVRADSGMEVLGAGPAQRLRELQANADEQSLNALIGRIQTALDTQGE